MQAATFTELAARQHQCRKEFLQCIWAEIIHNNNLTLWKVHRE
jgi:hypothetical protein